jgi:hypothetical protein
LFLQAGCAAIPHHPDTKHFGGAGVPKLSSCPELDIRVCSGEYNASVSKVAERQLADFSYSCSPACRADVRRQAMLTTPLCDLFGIDVPIILAPMGTCTSAELAAVVSNAGGLGGIGTLFRSFAAIKRDIDLAKTLTQPSRSITFRRRSMPRRFVIRWRRGRQ